MIGRTRERGSSITLFLGGDVMTGRGVDQVLPRPSEPTLHEPFVKSADVYVRLAEESHGAIPRPVDFRYVWGDAIAELDRIPLDARIVNLETSITRSDAFWAKGINYRMHPENVPCLTAARIDCCVLANNHVLDWGYAGLEETLDVLARAGVRVAGAGRNLPEAEAAAAIPVEGVGRVLVFGFGTETSGIPATWAAMPDRPGVHLLPALSEAELHRVSELLGRVRRPGDVAIASIHWGGNWGFAVPDEHVRFARGLVAAGFDVVHGHSSHHVRPIEVFDGKLILYGCGDFIDDYEGIRGYERFRDDLALMYFPTIHVATGTLAGLRMIPMRIKKFRVNYANSEEARWLQDAINRESLRFDFRVELHEEDRRYELRPPCDSPT